ncbi:MAG TPA: ABC transporter permease [bacterium]
MLNRIRHMLIKEFLQLFRDPRMRMVVFGVPVFQMLVIAFALTNDVTNISTALLDQDNSVASRELVQRFTSSGYFKITKYLESDDEIRPLLDGGHVRVIIHIPHGFEENILAGESSQFQLLADGTDSNSTAIIFGYASLLIGKYNREIVIGKFQSRFGAGFTPGTVEVETRSWFNENLESKFFFVPSLIGIMLVTVGMILTSIAIVREKEAGTIEQVMVTPITRSEFIFGKTIPYAIIGFVLMTFMLGLAYVVFGVVVKGSWLLLYALAAIYIVGNLGLALFISTSASTQQQALLTAFLFMMPAILLGGFLFPVHNMPEPVQWLTYADPVRWFLEIIRGVIMKGTGIEAIWPAVIGQTTLTVIFVALALYRFRKTVS